MISPPVLVRGEKPGDLLDQIKSWEAAHER
jgi:hypothetical protein